MRTTEQRAADLKLAETLEFAVTRWRAAEAELEPLSSESQRNADSMQYWLNQYNNEKAKVKALEAENINLKMQVETLQAPLAELARAAKE